MIIDLKNGFNGVDGPCPNCNTTLEVEGLPRWNSYAKCPNCQTDLMFEFDFILMDDGDEWDIYTIQKAD